MVSSISAGRFPILDFKSREQCRACRAPREAAGTLGDAEIVN